MYFDLPLVQQIQLHDTKSPVVPPGASRALAVARLNLAHLEQKANIKTSSQLEEQINHLQLRIEDLEVKERKALRSYSISQEQWVESGEELTRAARQLRSVNKGLSHHESFKLLLEPTSAGALAAKSRVQARQLRLLQEEFGEATDSELIALINNLHHSDSEHATDLLVLVRLLRSKLSTN